MMSSVGAFRIALVLLAGLLLSGCLPSTPQDEEKEPYFLAGKSRVNSMDYKGAIESFEKAVEVNPRSAAAHFELALLYDQKESDPAAAIYHYERYLKLAPNSGKEDMVKPRILACEQQLAQSVSLAPVSEKQQRELERLLEENKRLREDIQKWQAYASYLQSLTNQTSNPVPAAHVLQPVEQQPAASPGRFRQCGAGNANCRSNHQDAYRQSGGDAYFHRPEVRRQSGGVDGRQSEAESQAHASRPGGDYSGAVGGKRFERNEGESVNCLRLRGG